jgi:serralysin
MADAANGKPIIGIAEVAARLARDGSSWVTTPGQTTVLTYAFRTSAPTSGMPDGVGGFQPFSQAQIAAAERSLQAWADVADLKFVRVGDYSNDAVLLFANFTQGLPTGSAFAFLPGSGNRSPDALNGDVWTNINRPWNAVPDLATGGNRILTHEIGHALGLKHPSEYDGGALSGLNYPANAAFYEDSHQFTVMSYFAETATGASHGLSTATGPQIADIAAMQRIYGVNPTAFLGDSVYGYGANTGRAWHSADDPMRAPVFAVWDAGGVDTFDFSRYAGRQTIDLSEGGFSDVVGLKGNVAIAVGAVIEAALGGSGADLILGNAAANRLLGNDGNDSLDGFWGDDQLEGGAGDDFIRGFEDSDLIDGGDGADDVNGNIGTDTLHGGSGADTARGGRDADVVRGGAGDDGHLNGNLGDDTVFGGPGGDTLFGGRDADLLWGEDGGDLLSGDLGDDVLTGGGGADQFRLAQGFGEDRVTDFSFAEGDRIRLSVADSWVWTERGGSLALTLSDGASLVLTGLAAGSGSGEWLVFG